jgi:hypothetical protein
VFCALEPTATLATDGGTPVECSALGQHIAALARVEPDTASGITAQRAREARPVAAMQLRTLPQSRLAVEVTFRMTCEVAGISG